MTTNDKPNAGEREVLNLHCVHDIPVYKRCEKCEAESTTGFVPTPAKTLPEYPRVPEGLKDLAFALETAKAPSPYETVNRHWLRVLANAYESLQSAALARDEALKEADKLIEEWIGILHANGLRHSAIDGESLRSTIAQLPPLPGREKL